MGKRSKSTGNDEFVVVESPPIEKPIEGLALPGERKGVSISLRYFRRQTECFSDWKQGELKKFSGLTEKLKGYSEASLRSSPLCCHHKGPPKRERFALPEELSPDLELFELRVDMSNKARVHGVFRDETFFLVWLDRKHEVFGA